MSESHKESLIAAISGVAGRLPPPETGQRKPLRLVIDLERVVWDADYRREVKSQLQNRA